MNRSTLTADPPFSGCIPAEVRADLDAVANSLASGTPLDPEVARRIRERGAEARKKLLAERGVQNIGVDLIRELRGELPKS
jgi:hypothetical protein